MTFEEWRIGRPELSRRDIDIAREAYQEGRVQAIGEAASACRRVWNAAHVPQDGTALDAASAIRSLLGG